MNRSTGHVERPADLPFNPGRDSAQESIVSELFVRTSCRPLTHKLKYILRVVKDLNARYPLLNDVYWQRLGLSGRRFPDCSGVLRGTKSGVSGCQELVSKPLVHDFAREQGTAALKVSPQDSVGADFWLSAVGAERDHLATVVFYKSLCTLTSRSLHCLCTDGFYTAYRISPNSPVSCVWDNLTRKKLKVISDPILVS